MEKVKKFLTENKALVIIALIFLALAFVLYYVNNKRESVTYNPEAMGETPYVKKEYKANEYINVEIELIDILNEYYRYFMQKKIKNPEEAYKMLTNENQSKYESVDKYKKYVEKTITINTLNNKIKEYRKSQEYKNGYDIIDSEGNKYTIIENAVWDIKIIDNGK
ncbi:MAG: hypothetical protein OSJ65_05980 [Bacilli bacterium]|nr:hypothetical protein [Bacilli bacterium]